MICKKRATIKLTAKEEGKEKGKRDKRGRGKSKCDFSTQSKLVQFVWSLPGRRINAERTNSNIMVDGRVANYQVSCNDD